MSPPCTKDIELQLIVSCSSTFGITVVEVLLFRLKCRKMAPKALDNTITVYDAAALLLCCSVLPFIIAIKLRHVLWPAAFYL